MKRTQYNLLMFLTSHSNKGEMPSVIAPAEKGIFKFPTSFIYSQFSYLCKLKREGCEMTNP